MEQRAVERSTFFMLTRRLLLLGLGLAACGPPVDVTEAAGGAEPFAALQGVQLGMTARELARVRPAARPAPYTGYEEEIGGFSTDYRIPGSYSEDQEVSPRARVEAVSAGRTVEGIEPGLAEWRRIVRIAGAKLGSPPACSRVGVQRVVGLEAEWIRPGSSFTVTLFESSGSRAEPYTVRLGLMVAREPSRVGAHDERSRVACDDPRAVAWRGP
jgi:hypothetical protein